MPALKKQTDQLADIAQRHREKLVDVAYETGGAYLAQALSGIDLMTALYYRYLNHNPKKPAWPGRDLFLLSPGHYALPLYVILSHRGYFSEDLLSTFKDNGSPLELATHRGTVPGIEASGGSLAQTLSVGVGLALSARLCKKSCNTFVFMSDGEQAEGQIWEAAASAAHFGLSNLVAVIDKNGFQVDGATAQVMNMEPLVEKYRAFGWFALEVDGNDMAQVVEALDTIMTKRRDRPAVLVGATVRGKGVSFMEANPDFHYARLDGELAGKAKAQLKADWDAV